MGPPSKLEPQTPLQASFEVIECLSKLLQTTLRNYHCEVLTGSGIQNNRRFSSNIQSYEATQNQQIPLMLLWAPKRLRQICSKNSEILFPRHLT